MITSSPSRSTARSKEHPQFDDLASSQSTTAPIEDNKERDILSPTDTLVGGLTPTGRDATRNAESASGSSKGNATSKDYEGDIELGRATAGTGAGTGGEGGEDRLGASLEEGVLGVGGQLEEHEEDTTPDGGYGWVIVGCMMWQNAVTWGSNTTYGVYISYFIQNNYFEGGSTFKYAWVGGLSVAVALLAAPVVNWATRRWSFRIPMIFGSVCIVLGLCMAGVCTTFAGFIACQGLIFGLGLGFTMIPVQPLLSHWFDKRLAVAQGLANAGSGLGGLLLANVTRVTLQRYGVKWSLVINGLIAAVVLVPVLVLLRGRHKAVKAKSASFQTKWLFHPGYVWILLFGALVLMMYFIALYSLASFATYGLGLSQTQGAALQSILAASQAIGRPAWGFALDAGGRINMSMLCYIIAGLSCLVIWLPAKSLGVLIFFAIIQGMTGGTIWSAVAPMSRTVVGVQDLASALSIFWLFCVPFSLIGQPIAVVLLEYSQNSLGRTGPEAYYISVGLCGAMGILGGCMLYGAKRYQQGHWKVLGKT